MSRQFGVVVKKIEGLRNEIFIASSSFRAYEVMMEFLAPNLVGGLDASRNAKALGVYKGFFNIAKHSMNTDFLVSLSKLYDVSRDGTSIPKLLQYIRGNIRNLKKQDFLDYNKSRPHVGIAMDSYVGVSLSDVDKLEAELSKLSPQIGKLKQIRDKRIAHLEMKGLEELQNESIPKDLDSSSGIDYLTYEEIASLISQADVILNKISSLINKDVAEFRFLTETVTDDSEGLAKLVRKTYDSTPNGE